MKNLALLFTGFSRVCLQYPQTNSIPTYKTCNGIVPQAHISTLEASPEDFPLLLAGLQYLVDISYVDETEVFKTCLDYWNYFVPEVRFAAQSSAHLYAAVCTAG